jgi:hypothetical protein
VLSKEVLNEGAVIGEGCKLSWVDDSMLLMGTGASMVVEGSLDGPSI